MLQFDCDERINNIQMRVQSALRREGDPISLLATLSEQTGVTSEEMRALYYKEYGWWIYRVGIMSHIDDLPVMQRFMFDNAVRGAYGNPGPSRLIYESVIKPMAPPDAVRYVDNLLAQPE